MASKNKTPGKGAVGEGEGEKMRGDENESTAQDYIPLEHSNNKSVFRRTKEHWKWKQWQTIRWSFNKIPHYSDSIYVSSGTFFSNFALYFDKTAAGTA